MVQGWETGLLGKHVCGVCVVVHSTALFFFLSVSFSLSVRISDYSWYSRQATRSESKNSRQDANLTGAQFCP